MPVPTNPACIGSWPEPPPEISATLPERVAAARVTKVGIGCTRTRSAWAAPKPLKRLRQDVVDLVDQLFHASCLPRRWAASACCARRMMRLEKSRINASTSRPVVGPELGHGDAQLVAARAGGGRRRRALGVGTPVECQEALALLSARGGRPRRSWADRPPGSAPRRPDSRSARRSSDACPAPWQVARAGPRGGAR